MFGKRNRSDLSNRPASLAEVDYPGDPVESKAVKGSASAAARAASSPAGLDGPRRNIESRTSGIRRSEDSGSRGETFAVDAAEGRTLVVGHGICLSGEIKTCDKLVVEGQVNADLNDGQELEISETGLFKGAASVKNALISGHFDGELTVHGCLYLQATGRIDGVLTYAEVEIERGGKICGEMTLLKQSSPKESSREESRPAAVETLELPKERPASEPAAALALEGDGGTQGLAPPPDFAPRPRATAS